VVVVILRPGKTPSGEEVRNLLRRLIGRIRRDWPDTRITTAMAIMASRRKIIKRAPTSARDPMKRRLNSSVGTIRRCAP